MKLTELIKYLINPESLGELIIKLEISNESEALLIYMQEDLNITSDISIFEIEETEDDLFFEKGRKIYPIIFFRSCN